MTDFDCALCREQVDARLTALERGHADHAKQLALHDVILARIERRLDSIDESGRRVEVILERILDYVRRPDRDDRTQVYGGA